MRDRGASLLGSRLLYSQCWEDVTVAREALRIPAGGTVLAVAAAGDNVLALLQDDPARIVAVDVNPAQVALVRLKVAAIRCLPDAGDVARFLGAIPSRNRSAVYRASIRPCLLDVDASYWDTHIRDLERGVIHAGRFERYVAAFRRFVLPIVPGRRVVHVMLAVTDLAEQRRLFDERWNSRRWRLLFRLFFSRPLLRRFGRDAAFFEHAAIADVGAHYLERAQHALTAIPIWENPYVTSILTGSYGQGRRLPDYLRPDVQAVIRPRLDRLDVRTASLEETLRALPAASVDAFYLSDVFELSTPASHAATLAEIARVGRPGARLCYWNNLVPRGRPEALASKLTSEGAEAGRLHAADRAFLYSRLVIETVSGAVT